MVESENDSIRQRSPQDLSSNVRRVSSPEETDCVSTKSRDGISEKSNQLPSHNKGEFRLKPQIGLFSAVALIMGNMIGAGIFVTSGTLLERAQSPGLCLTIWTVCGIYSLLGAIAYCEIGTLIPKSGGEYIYFLEVFGPLHKFFGPILAFIFSWVGVFLLRPSGVAILALSFASYFTTPILNALDFCPDDYLFYVVTRLVSVLCVCFFSFINCYTVTIATRVQNVFTIAKLTAIAIIIGGGLYYLGLGYTETLAIGFEGSATSFGQIAQAFYGGLWTYDGWNGLNAVTEELRNPFRNLPLAIIIAVPLTTVCYVLVNVSYLTVLTQEEIITSEAVAVDWAEKALGPASFLIPLGVVLSVVGATHISIFLLSRVAQVAGREGHAPEFLSYLHIEKRSPIGPIILNAIVVILMIIPADIGSLVDFFGFTSSIFYCAAMIALIVMRFTKKDEHRPIKVPIIIPIIVMLISGCLVFAPIIVDPQMGYFYALLFIFSGFIFYVPFVYYKKEVPGMRGFTKLFQKVLLVAPPSR